MKVLGVIAGLLAIAFFAFGGWYLANSKATIRLPADQAAISVAKRYEVSAIGTFAARHIGASTNVAGARAVYIVSRDGSDIARVTLKRFRKVGWHEAAYERLEQNSPEEKK